MMTLDEKFKILEADNAPGQEIRQVMTDLSTIMRGGKMNGIPVDFSHGDVDAFPPPPGSDKIWNDGFRKGAQQAYTEYRGAFEIRERLAERIGKFTGRAISADNELIITPGTQGALFMALATSVTEGTKVAVIEPDYFANRKLVRFFGGEVVPIPLNYQKPSPTNSIDLDRLEDALKKGTKVLIFSTPNNPTGLVYSHTTIHHIGTLTAKYGVTVIVDQLYSRMLYSGENYTHFCSCKVQPENTITIMGPSKTESLSGFRLGVAFGTPKLIDRMERLQAIVSLRASGYNQAVLETWFQEPKGWLEKRISEHEAIRDRLLKIFNEAHLKTSIPQAGSYLFPTLPPLGIDLNTFVRLLRYQAKVTVTPGTEFAPSFSNHIRLNFSQDHKAAIDAAKRIVKIAEIYSV
ncbi:pyridoxal phosphate-dependent aminotransferase [Saccharicrinis sp. GN24d3]|uniref:pyridoxal phosphate-dependent aminotransferase n=1 Tax=Saccharicrinis sp. GN24d3 TaxID=3458416 RepID=UPI004034F8C0